MELETIQTIIELDERVKTATSPIYNSAVAARVCDPILGHIFGELEFNIADILFIAVLSEVHVLAIGPTGRGKTELIKLLCEGIFGQEQWFLQKLNPHLNEEVFANIDMRTFKESSLSEAILPAPFLNYAATIFDEINRTPGALGNILLGFCDGEIQLKCGLKYGVGYRTRNNGEPLNTNINNESIQYNQSHYDDRYHLVFGTMNDGKEYVGSFVLDKALIRRLTLGIPFDELRVTPHDLLKIVEEDQSVKPRIRFDCAIDKIIKIHHVLLGLPRDPLATIYLLYLCNIGRCPYSMNGYHTEDGSQELCHRKECRILKISNGFCASVSGFDECLIKLLKRASTGMTALRVSRIVQAIKTTCADKDSLKIDKLRKFADVNSSGDKLYKAVMKRYLNQVSVCVQDIKAMVPFVGLGGKVKMAPEYVAKHFAGSEWYALQNYAQETYIRMENFFREHHTIFHELSGGNGAIETLKQRLNHAERFSDPVIRHVIEPLLDRYQSNAKTPDQVAIDINNTMPIHAIAKELVC